MSLKGMCYKRLFKESRTVLTEKCHYGSMSPDIIFEGIDYRINNTISNCETTLKIKGLKRIATMIPVHWINDKFIVNILKSNGYIIVKYREYVEIRYYY